MCQLSTDFCENQFLCNPANERTNKQTNKRRWKHNLLGVDNKLNVTTSGKWTINSQLLFASRSCRCWQHTTTAHGDRSSCSGSARWAAHLAQRRIPNVVKRTAAATQYADYKLCPNDACSKQSASVSTLRLDLDCLPRSCSRSCLYEKVGNGFRWNFVPGGRV